MERRHFIHIAAAGAVGIAVTGTATPGGDQSIAGALARPDLLTLLGDARAVELGKAYCATAPREASIEVLTAAIFSDAGIKPTDSEAAVHERVSEQIRDEFARGHTIKIDGWILAPTEARQCALYSLLTA